ncbi:MAG: alkylation response protein AidB-like acyl-CoA dehydrogenase [Zhongshania aliphaticivorans]|jgi:alkylation response protein AidB-like acyl-CoA dehydrogenase|uniref:acyl-CoA dehydrogenase family protein n=1 Tax=Zhongshania aliphaticivorans TaxID=1470434 RepID=UPI00025C1107|nr:acyl-CoA dehydrogenase domain-containing protein [gamma proteobacterium BDW918]|tara:strand:- start:3065 stop:4243 length:1179 start_codon:yes stop_codon:yes gene_type:complete
MHAKFSADELAFQSEVRSFMRDNYSADLAARIHHPDTFRDASVEWQKCLDNKGWAAHGWPVEHGGQPWSATQKYIYSTELAAAGAPDVVPMGIKMVAPVLYSYGSEEQKARFLPATKASDIWWCQGYSEPGAGSDLAALQTKAVRDGDDYLVTGTKIWTTYAQYADWIFCLVRTSNEGKPQQGISFLLIDMKSPGVTVSPIISIDDEHHLNEVSFDNVRVPMANRIGEENQGWTYAKALLTYERTALSGVPYCKRTLANIREMAAQSQNQSSPLLSSPDFQARLADVEMDVMALEFLELRVLSAIDSGGAPGMESSLLKLKGTEMQQAVQSLQWDVVASFGGVLPAEHGAQALWQSTANMARRSYMFGRASTIYGGSNEVQRNIIAKFALGL